MQITEYALDHCRRRFFYSTCITTSRTEHNRDHQNYLKVVAEWKFRDQDNDPEEHVAVHKRQHEFKNVNTNMHQALGTSHWA